VEKIAKTHENKKITTFLYNNDNSQLKRRKQKKEITGEKSRHIHWKTNSTRLQKC
jgi:hypothetical protein